MAAKKSRKSKDKPEPTEQPSPCYPGSSDETGKSNGHCVVGIGASAGGLEAVTALLRALPGDTGLGFILVQHLDPTHPSALVEILAKITSLRVSEAREGVSVLPNHLYVIPPNCDMVLAEGVLRLSPRPAMQTPHMPIDRFLHSLAETLHNKALGVILSGTGSDGTSGLQAIKDEGGITFAQDETARHDGMPRSAIAAGCVDYVLSPEEIALELKRIAEHPWLSVAEARPTEVADSSSDDVYSQIIRFISGATAVDFEHYKRPTLLRRIERRIMVRKLDGAEKYLRLLREDPTEVHALFQEVLIPVTSFFRNPKLFDALTHDVFPKLLEDRPVDSAIRVWVPGCSTGEEAYSLAICLTEFLDHLQNKPAIKLFATDVNDAAIETARTGRYLESIGTDVSAGRLRRFFVKTERGYQIGKSLRDQCVFARHDVTKNAPFSQLDLISCRNLLIYIDSILQQRVVPIFHYALKPEGFLVLGGSESVSNFADLFRVFDRNQKIFVRQATAGRRIFTWSPSGELAAPALVNRSVPDVARRTQDVRREADRIVLDQFAPASVVVDDKLQVIQFHGRTGNYLEPAPGAPSLDLLPMARQGLLVELRVALDEARNNDVPVRRGGIQVQSETQVQEINLTVVPFRSQPSGERFFIILFEPAPIATQAAVVPPAPSAEGHTSASDRELERLQQELATTKAYAQSVVEEHETAFEELQAAHEEIVSSNEELQSTNEELQTAKEELQATNEELTTVNDELQNRIAVASQLSNDLANLVDSLNIPTIVLGPDLCIRRFSPSAQRMLNLLPSDMGRPVGDFKLKVNVPDLESLATEVMDTLAVKEREVTDHEGRWYKLFLRPYKTLENRIDGTVISLVDIDPLKIREQQLEAARDYAQAVIETMREPLVVLDEQQRVQSVNPAFCRWIELPTAQCVGQSLYSIGNGRLNVESLRHLLEKILPEGASFEGFEISHSDAAGQKRTCLANARRLQQPEARENSLILLALEDISERKALEIAVLEVATQEQTRIGHELHDSTGQELTGLAYMARTLDDSLVNQPRAAGELAHKICEGLQRALVQVRALAMGLVPVEVDAEGLAAALTHLAAKKSELYGIKCAFERQQSVKISNNDQANQLYRIAQECVINAVKHGEAKNIRIGLRRDGSLLILTIRDDGKGVPQPVDTTQGMGLRIMHYRASLIGAHLAIEPGPGGGTVVTCTLRDGGLQ